MTSIPARMRGSAARGPRGPGRGCNGRPRRAGPARPFDLVFADAPCSGSGAWRAPPEGKWRLSPGRLDELLRAYRPRILDEIAALVAPGGRLAYATCSLLEARERRARSQALSRPAPGLALPATAGASRPLDGGDGFFVALLHPRRAADELH